MEAIFNNGDMDYTKFDGGEIELRCHTISNLSRLTLFVGFAWSGEFLLFFSIFLPSYASSVCLNNIFHL